jgi:hypothetical protein
VARQAHYCGSDVDPPDHRTEHAGTRPSTVLPREDFRSLPGTTHKGGLWRCRKGKVRLQGSLHPGWHSAPSLSTYSWQARQKEPSHTGHWIHSRPRREVRGGNANELGELPRQRARERTVAKHRIRGMNSISVGYLY